MTLRYQAPLHDWVLVEAVEVTTLRGLVIPGKGNTAESSVYWRVLMVGPGRWENGNIRPVSAKVGDLCVVGPGVRLLGYDFISSKQVLVRDGEIAALIGHDGDAVVHFSDRPCDLVGGTVANVLPDLTCPACLSIVAAKAVS